MTRRFKPNVSLVAMSWGMRSAMLRPWTLRMRRSKSLPPSAMYTEILGKRIGNVRHSVGC
jgi:hypothetical protein